VLSGRGLCDELITRPEESYRLWRVVVCDLETSKRGGYKPAKWLWIQTHNGLWRRGGKKCTCKIEYLNRLQIFYLVNNTNIQLYIYLVNFSKCTKFLLSK